jgi:hypothetical protein
MITGKFLPDGGCLRVRVFIPRWWQLHRWVGWLLLPSDERTTVELTWAVPVIGGRLGRKTVRARVWPPQSGRSH